MWRGWGKVGGAEAEGEFCPPLLERKRGNLFIQDIKEKWKNLSVGDLELFRLFV